MNIWTLVILAPVVLFGLGFLVALGMIVWSLEDPKRLEEEHWR